MGEVKVKSLMDPPLINEGSFTTANPSLSEIWPFSNGGNSENGGMLGLRMGSGSGFVNGLIDGLLSNGLVGTMNRDGSIEESTVTEQSGSLGGGGRKRRENVSEDESSKLVSTTSSGNEMVIFLFLNNFVLENLIFLAQIVLCLIEILCCLFQ